MAKIDVNSNDDLLLTDINRYNELFFKVGKSTAEKNELAVLEDTYPHYKISAADFNSVVSATNLNTSTVSDLPTYPLSGGTSDALTVSGSYFTKSNGKSIKWQQNGNNTGAVTLNANSTGIEDLKANDGSTLGAEDLEDGQYYEAIWDATQSFFVLASSGADNTTWLQQYTGANEVIQSNGKDVSVKVGDNIYNELHSIFINDGGAGQIIPSTTLATSQADLKATVAGVLEMHNPESDWVYQGFIAKDELWDAGLEGQNGIIKSSQRGSLTMSTTTQTVNISSVNSSNSVIMLQITGAVNSISYSHGGFHVSAEFNSDTQIELNRYTTGENVIVAWQVVEYMSGAVESIQYYDLTSTSTSSNINITIGAVDLTKTYLIPFQEISTTIATSNMSQKFYARLTSATNVRYSPIFLNSYSKRLSGFVVELK